tara:strand:+ start:585 stop:1346 length:762 start_codon:yes stop_codon:yes gene_type:complete
MKSKVNKNSFVNKTLNNKYVLYLVAAVSLLDILGYILKQQFSAVLFFYLIAMIVFYFNKNMTLVLGSALIGTTLLHILKNLMGIKEGFKEGTDHSDSKEDTTSKEANKVIDKLVDEIQDDEDKDEDEDEDEDKDKEQMKNKRKAGMKNKEKYANQKINPGLYNIPNKDNLKKQLGKADKMENAYDNLEKVVGENGIKSMSNNTKELVKQQNELLKGLKEVTPAINEAMGAIGKIDLNNLTKMFNNVNNPLLNE